MGEFLGLLIILFYALTISKYILKLITKYFGERLSKYKRFYEIYRKVSTFISKYHKIFGLLTIIFILIHFIVQFSTIGLSITGVIAALLMLFQVLLGLYAVLTKKINNTWRLLHRLISFIILIAILIHIV